MPRQSIEEILRLVLFVAPTPATRRRPLVLWQSQALGDQLIVVLLESPLLRHGERAGALLDGLLDRLFDLGQQVFHLARLSKTRANRCNVVFTPLQGSFERN